jgi:LPS-assembly lipoprotein
MRRRRLLGLAIAAASLGGCGFQPLYGPAGIGSGVVQPDLAAIEVANLPERDGQLIREALQARLDPGNLAVAKRYLLDVNFSVGGDGIAILPDSTTTRIRLIGSATWRLRALTPQRSVVTDGSTSEIDGINVFNSQYFAADLETEAVHRRLAGAAADAIILQLARYFNNQAKPPKPT